MREALRAVTVAALVACPGLAGAEAPPTGRKASEPQKAAAQQQKPATPKPAEVPVPPLAPNEVLSRLRGKLKVAASSSYEGWPAQNAIDGDPKTSWFSATGDAAALKRKPWLEVTFPHDVTVQHVLALGNREPDWPVNYSIVVARIELFDAGGKPLATQGNETAVPTFDIEFHFKAPVEKVRRLRFVSLVDQGDKNPYQDIAIGELRAW